MTRNTERLPPVPKRSNPTAMKSSSGTTISARASVVHRVISAVTPSSSTDKPTPAHITAASVTNSHAGHAALADAAPAARTVITACFASGSHPFRSPDSTIGPVSVTQTWS